MIDFITNNFEPSSEAFWKQKIQFELDGADYNNSLLTNTNEGIFIKPFYHSDSFEKIDVPHLNEPFKLCKKITVLNEIENNLEAVNYINTGINSLKFLISKPINIKVLFKDLHNKGIEFHFDFSFLEVAFLEKLISHLKDEKVFLNIDIIGNLAKKGNWFKNRNTDFNLVENLLEKSQSNYILSVNTNLYQNAGANIAQQIAYALAHSNEYLTVFGENIASKMQFNFATGSNFFFEIAKIRAFRYLFNLILTKYNTSINTKVHSEPSDRNKTIFNKKLNATSTKSECISAITGGANSVSVSYLQITEPDKLIDTGIANDSYYIESITKQLAEKALSIFKSIEKSGGFLSQLKEGTIQKKIKENAAKELEQFENSPQNQHYFKHINLDKTNFDLTLNSSTRNPQQTLIIPISPYRLAEKMEQKRLKNEA